MGWGISFTDWRDAVELWQQNGTARSVTACVVCWVPVPNSHPEFGTPLFDICEMCLERERQSASENAVGQMTLDFTF